MFKNSFNLVFVAKKKSSWLLSRHVTFYINTRDEGHDNIIILQADNLTLYAR